MLKPVGKPVANKISVSCPHCGHVQQESSFAKSTYCRKCSMHFEPGREIQADPTAESAVQVLFKKLTRLVSGEANRKINCFDCDTAQVVSTSAKSSLCPGCGAYIDLRDFKITASFSRAIQTQGCVIVTSRGELTSNKIICGSAQVRGKVLGNLTCTGKLEVKIKGRLAGSLEAQQLVIAKGSELECVRPLKAKKAEIHGKISCRVIADAVSVSKTGNLEGTVYAKAITVEKGGKFYGELIIGSSELKQQELLPSTRKSSSQEGAPELALGF